MKVRVIIATILLLTLIPPMYFTLRWVPILSDLESNKVSESYKSFSDQVRSESLSHSQIADRLSHMADGEKLIANGFGLLKVSLLYWLIALVFILVAQGYLLHTLLCTLSIKLSEQDVESGATV